MEDRPENRKFVVNGKEYWLPLRIYGEAEVLAKDGRVPEAAEFLVVEAPARLLSPVALAIATELSGAGALK